MIALWIRRLWPYAIGFTLLVVAWLAIDAWRGRRGGRDARIAHQATIYAEHDVYRTDTLWRHDTLPLAPARAAYRAARDVALRDLRDTAAVKVALAKADTAIALDSTAVHSAAVTIRARDTLVVRVKEELAIAQPSPRLSARALALYDPIAGIPAASLEASVRVVGRLSLLMRGDQRFVPGERPRGYLGVALTF